MTDTKIKKANESRTARKAKPELPWNVILHNEWNNEFRRVIMILRRVIPGMTFAKATKITYEAHRSGQAVIKSCHRELAELYQEQLLGEKLTVTIEPGR